MSPISESQVFTLFANLDENKSYINIPNKFIKLAASILATPLTEFYNESILTGIVPAIFKVSRVTAICKSGDACDPSNFRPIAIIS